MRGLADVWRNTSRLDGKALADLIYNDGIDILVDLAGHTSDNRLDAFTWKPAPVQVTYLGYFTTTGLSTMDYWLTDEVCTPDDSIEMATEEIWRLPGCSLCYVPPANAPQVTERTPKAPVVLGCFNNLSKVSSSAMDLWADVLRRLPDAKLLLKASQLSNQTVCKKVLAEFLLRGINRDRLILHGRIADANEHLALYGEVDIALDTVPRTGGATTMEALWMGVPVVSLAGKRYVERLSATMLSAVGLTELICIDTAGYIDCVVKLAENEEKRRVLRKSLRERLKSSQILDGLDLAKRLERAYGEMWRKSLIKAQSCS